MTTEYQWSSEETQSTAYIAGPVAERLLRIRPRRLLDAGCGNGRTTWYYLSCADRVFAMEQSASGFEHARRVLGERASVEQGSVYDDLRKPFDDECFDCIVSTEVIEHLYDPRAFVRRVFDALEPGGHFILTTPYHGYLKNVALAVTGKMDDHFTALWDHGHIKFWSPATLRTVLEEASFRVVEFAGLGRLPWLWKSMLFVARR